MNQSLLLAINKEITIQMRRKTYQNPKHLKKKKKKISWYIIDSNQSIKQFNQMKTNHWLIQSNCQWRFHQSNEQMLKIVWNRFVVVVRNFEHQCTKQYSKCALLDWTSTNRTREYKFAIEQIIAYYWQITKLERMGRLFQSYVNDYWIDFKNKRNNKRIVILRGSIKNKRLPVIRLE